MRTNRSFPISAALIAASTAGLFLLSGCSSNGLMIYKNTKQVKTNSGFPRSTSGGIFGLSDKTGSPTTTATSVKAGEVTSTDLNRSNRSLTTIKQPANKTYTIRKGDTMSQIALDHKVGIDELASLNNMHKDDRIFAGQKLTLPYGAVVSSRSTQVAPTPRKPSVEYYTVVKGDYLGKIAQKTNTSVSDLREWNNLSNDNIHIGWKLALGPNGTPKTPRMKSSIRATKEIPASGIHVVKSGESISTIATMYKGMTSGKLKAMNGLTTNRILPGQELKLRGSVVADNTTGSGSTTLDTPPTDDTLGVPEEVAATGDVPPISLPHFVDQQNDTLKSVADMYGSKIEWILTKNPSIKTDADLRTMKEISVPVQQ